MREEPYGSDLLMYARDVLLNDLMPKIPKEDKITLLMIANAMKISAKQLQHGDENSYIELATLQDLLQRINQAHSESSAKHNSENHLNIYDKDHKLTMPILSPSELQKQLLELNRQLAKLIRKGDLKDYRLDTFNHIKQITAIRAAESGG